MNGTILPELTDEMKSQIKKVVKYHYGFEPKDEKIEKIDSYLRNHYLTLHDQRIIRELAADDAQEDLLKNIEQLGSLEFEKIWLEKIIFKYLTLAKMCFVAGIPTGTICLCRTAIESGLREKLAEKIAGDEFGTGSEVSDAKFRKLKELRGELLPNLIKLSHENKIIDKSFFDELFKEFEYKNHGRKILDKFIHGDIIWIVDFLYSKGEDIRVVGAQSKIEEYKIISDSKDYQIALNILKASYKLAEALYYKK